MNFKSPLFNPTVCRYMSTAALLLGCAFVSVSSRVSAAPASAPAPIKIGFIASLTGAASEPSQRMLNGAKLYLDSIGNRVLGHPIQLVVENDESRRIVALDKVDKLVKQDKVSVISGIYLSNILYAVAPAVEKNNEPTVICVSGADDVTQRQPYKWLIRTSWSASQPAHPFGEYAYKVLNHKRIVTIASDYAFGYEVVGGFQRSFEQVGGKIIQKIWVPVGFTDYTQFIKQIRGDADALFICISSESAFKLAQQLDENGVKKPIIGGATLFEEPVLAKVGKSLVGAISSMPYSVALNTTDNEKFIEAYRKKYGEMASFYSECGYTNMMFIVKAIESLNGNVSDRNALMAALRKVELKHAPRGPMKLDSYGNPIDNIYIRKVEFKDGEYKNTVIHTYPMVSQFWTWPPKEYLKAPAYSIDFPPCTFCDSKDKPKPNK